MTKTTVLEILCVAALTSLLVLHGAQAAGRGPGTDFLGNGKKVPAIFTFGDSIVDAGTNAFLPKPAFLANFMPYGQTYFLDPLVASLMDDSGLIAWAYLDPNTKDYTKGVDFASAGSGSFQSVKDTLAALLYGTVANMDEQLQWFRTVKASLISCYGQQSTLKFLGHSIFIVSTGSNDITRGYLLNPTMTARYTPDEFTSLMIEVIYNTTKTLFDEGAKKIVLSALGPLGCLPGNVAGNNGTCLELLNDFVKLFNSKLPALLQRVNANCHNANVVYTEHYSVVEGFIKDGEEYGFSKGAHACCGIGELNGQFGGCGAVDANGTAIHNLCSQEELAQYVFWDYAHPTEKAYGILANMFINGEGVIKPYNISQLCEH